MPPTAPPTPAPRRTGSLRLRTTVLGTDALALALGWAITVAVVSTADVVVAGSDLLLGLLTVVGVGLLALRATGAHQRRIARVRRLELGATTKAALAPAALLPLLLPRQDLLTVLGAAVTGAVVWTALLAVGRAAVGEWIRGIRARGHMMTPVLVIGTGRAREVAQFLEAHPHLGFSVADTVELIPEDQDEALRMLAEVSRHTGASGAVLTDAGDPVVQPLAPALATLGLHVHVATGVQGFELGTAVTSSLAGELFLDFTPREVPEWELAVVRALDVAIATAVLVLSLPVTLAVAAAIRLTDGGSPFYVHERVGRGGRHFPMLKFRSMRVGADQTPLDPTDNGREGPLTKVARDPRVTPVGRLIRATSIDELPQLVNVLRGDMSIVGPRPALPGEHAQFDAALRRRTEVRPGLTGLWQVEGRDLPSFELYRRLDLLYVDSFSVGLYLTTLLRTVTALGGQTLRALTGDGEATLAPERHDELVTLDLSQHDRAEAE